jgi:hypothetical protein
MHARSVREIDYMKGECTITSAKSILRQSKPFLVHLDSERPVFSHHRMLAKMGGWQLGNGMIHVKSRVVATRAALVFWSALLLMFFSLTPIAAASPVSHKRLRGQFSRASIF